MANIYPEKQKNKLQMQFLNFVASQKREIYEEIDKLSLNKSSGLMGTQAFCLQQGKLTIETHLQFAINESIIQSQFPSFFKKTYINPVFKKKKHRLHQIIGLFV